MIDELNTIKALDTTEAPEIRKDQSTDTLSIQGDTMEKDAPLQLRDNLDFSGLKPLSQEPTRAVAEASEKASEIGETRIQKENEDVNESHEKQEYWDRVLTGNLETVPVELKEAIGLDSLDDLGAQQQLAGNIMRSWAVDNKNLSQEEVMANWNQHREKLSGEYQAGNDDYELFLAVSESNKVKVQEKDMINDLYKNAFELGLGEDLVAENTPNILGSKLNKVPVHLRTAADSVVSQAMVHGRNERKRLASDVDLLWKGMQFFLVGDTPPEKAKQGDDPKAIEYREGYMTRLRLHAPYMNKAVARLEEMGEQDQAKIYFILKEKKRKQDTVPWAVARAMGRGINNLWMNAAQFGGNMSSYMMDELAGPMENIFGASEFAKEMKGSAKQLDDYLKGAEKLRRMAQEELATIELKGDPTWVDQMLVDSAGAAPVAGLAFSGAIGLTLLGTTDMGRQVATARQLAPDGELGAQLGASIAAGTVNTALNLYLGHLGQKVLSRSLQNFAKARATMPKAPSLLDTTKLYGGAAGRSLAYMVGDFAQMHGTNKLMELVELGAQELAGKLSDKSSGIDWKAWREHNKQFDTHLREALAMLPFVLIGAGKMSLHHFR